MHTTLQYIFFSQTYFYNSRFLFKFAHYRHPAETQDACNLWCLNYKIFIINNITNKIKTYG